VLRVERPSRERVHTDGEALRHLLLLQLVLAQLAPRRMLPAAYHRADLLVPLLQRLRLRRVQLRALLLCALVQVRLLLPVDVHPAYVHDFLLRARGEQ